MTYGTVSYRYFSILFFFFFFSLSSSLWRLHNISESCHPFLRPLEFFWRPRLPLLRSCYPFWYPLTLFEVLPLSLLDHSFPRYGPHLPLPRPLVAPSSNSNIVLLILVLMFGQWDNQKESWGLQKESWGLRECRISSTWVASASEGIVRALRAWKDHRAKILWGLQ